MRMQNEYGRQSKNVHTHGFGRYLLCICEQFNLVILNRCFPGDEEGNYTYIVEASIKGTAVAKFCSLFLLTNLAIKLF